MLRNLVNSVRSTGSSFLGKLSNIASTAGNFIKNIFSRDSTPQTTQYKSKFPLEPLDKGWYAAHHGQTPSTPVLNPQEFAQKYSQTNKMQNLGYEALQPQIYREPKKGAGRRHRNLKI